MERKKKYCKVERTIIEPYDELFDDFINRIVTLKNEMTNNILKSGFEGGTFTVNSEHYRDEGGCTYEWLLICEMWRWETDAEIETRKKKSIAAKKAAAKRKEKKEAAEKAELERLKRKYES